ncbi:MAG TPA: PKD domain-containing protein [Bacteroidia bacterium]|nr:PKD domain-containing protein [Bacteroidia bacterium]
MLLHKRYSCFLTLILSFLSVFSQSEQSLIRFTENKHQWQDFILYRAQLDGGALFAEVNAITYGFYDKEAYRASHLSNKPVKEVKTTGFRILFANANPLVTVESENASKDYCNYFIGNDKSHWASNVKNYQRLLYKNLWQGINLEMLGQYNSVKSNFYVKPGGDPSEIQLQYNKTGKIYLKEKKLIIKTPLNELIEHEPYAYQIIDRKTVEVPCDFKLKKNTVSFSFPKGYNKKYELVIDPVLVFATLSGSLADNFGFCATYDPQGNLYSGGIAFAQGYPLLNAYDSVFNYNPNFPARSVDVVITKYDSTGTFLHYSTYLGGSKCETVTSLIVDAQNNLFMHGTTGSADFPTTSLAYDNSFGGGDSIGFTGSGTYYTKGSDLYVAKLSVGGNQLLASTFIGGSKNDGLNVNNYYTPSGGESGPDSLQYNYGDQFRGEIQLDNIGNPVISSCSRSSDFPIKNGFGPSLKGQQDAVVFKMDPNLSKLIWSTFVGGSDNESGCGLYIGKNNEVYTTGGTRSNDFPIKPGAYNSSSNGGMSDAYVTKISKNGDSLLAATYYGTKDYDQSFFIQLDKNQNVYIYGQALGVLPIKNVLYADSNGTQFVTKFNNNLSQIIYSTNIGNDTAEINISPTAFLVDYCENVYISGWGGNFKTGQKTFGMPIKKPLAVPGANNADGYNFYMLELAKNCDSLLFSTYFGGDVSFEHVHGGTSRYDKRGVVYQTLCTGCALCPGCPANQDFPVSAGAWPYPISSTINRSGNCSIATFKIDFKKPLVVANYNANKIGCAPLTVNFNNVSSGATSYFWDFGNNDTTSHVPNPVRTYTTAGTYTAMLIAKNPTACNTKDTSIITITVYPKPTASFVPQFDSCKNSTAWQNTSSIGSGFISYHWNFGNGQIDTIRNPGDINYQPGTYTTTLVVVSNNGCYDSTKQVLHFGIKPVQSYPDTVICLGSSIQLNASGGVSYSWQPNASLNNSNSSNPIATPTSNTIYTVTIHQLDGAGRTCLSTLTDTIKINPKANAAFKDTVNKCGNTVSFTDLSYANITAWHWNFGDSLFNSINNTQNPTHSYTHIGNYTVSLWVNNQYNCPDSVERNLTLHGFTPISISRGVLVCKGKSVQLNATGGISYTWSPANSLDSANVHDPIATPTTTTNYTLQIMQLDSLGNKCGPSTLYTNITIPFYSSSQLTAYATPDTIIDGNTSQLSTSLTDGYIVWSPDYGLSNDSILNPVASPHHTTTYQAVYIDPNGCMFPVSRVTIYVLSSGCNASTVFVPNTFTPNDDGKNDVLYARSNFITDIHFVVADRWGQIVFETYDINIGWDGFFNGKPCNPDVFGYYITYKCNNGQQSFRKGNVTLIR